MDDTHNTTRASEAAATRKRRSSILKSQRAPRTPFSELEFNVATPTDTTKSRRVSFSRRMGVAEFATNEGTTTWKNFYEEHNKSLESSGNDSAANARQSISHIGKRIFDQQFEEVEAIDIGGAFVPGSRAADFNLSINNINLTQQLAALECTVDDKKLAAPQQHFELSSLTDHQSKIFSNDLTIPTMGEMSNQINVNFSIMNPIGNNDKYDDLDEIQRDLERPHNVVCPGPFREDGMSEYIEVDLNMTHVPVRNEESNMSITDPIHSPKVQEVSKSVSTTKTTSTAETDWAIDKENIAVVNPYVTPCETDNFAINEAPDEVLVFDGKRLTVQSEKKNPIAVVQNDKDSINFRKILLPDAPLNVPQRKTIVLNVNDDLPNFIDDQVLPQNSFACASAQEMKQTMLFDEDLSITQAVPNKIDVVKRKTIDCENTIGNISITQAIPTNIIIDQNVPSERRRTIHYENDNADISMTQAVPGNVMFEKPETHNKRRTTVYDDGNISFTQMVPANLIVPENEMPNKTIVYQNNVNDISFTQALSNNKLLENLQSNKNVLEKSIVNISMTQALPSNILLPQNKEPQAHRRKTIVYENNDGDISMTQAIPTNILTDKHVDTKRRTIVFESDTADISITQAIPAKIIQELSKSNIAFNKSTVESCKEVDSESQKSILNVSNELKQCMVQEIADNTVNKFNNSPRKRLTIMYDDDGDISMTQALPANILSISQLIKSEKRKTIVFEDNAGDISMTQVLPSNILLKDHLEEKLGSQTLVFVNQDISATHVVTNASCLESKSVIIDKDKSIVLNKTLDELKYALNELASGKQNKELEEGIRESGNLTMTKPIPNSIFDIENEMLKKDMENFANLTQFGEKTLLQEKMLDKSIADVLVYQTTTLNETNLKINKTEMDLEEQESNKSIGVQKLDISSAKSVKSNLSTVTNDVECMEEDDIAVQTDFVNKNNSPIKCNLEVCNLKVENRNNKTCQDINENKKSFLHELLDMSSISTDDVADKNITTNIVPMEDNTSKTNSESDSNDRIFVIRNDSEDKIDNDNKDLSMNNVKEMSRLENVGDLNEIENEKLPALEYQAEDSDGTKINLETKLAQLSHRVSQEEKKTPPQNRHYEKIVSSDLQAKFKDEVVNNSSVKDFANLTKTRKSFKEADDTKELLEMLSDFTDSKPCAPIKEEDEKDVSCIKTNIDRNSIALEHKTEIPEPRRLSFAPKRQSIVLSREDLLKNISMAQQVLRKSCFEIDDSENIDDTESESPELNESVASPKKSVRMSNEVVKTLHFEDESFSDASVKSDMKLTPLKKTAFGETSYMNENKANVIPTYLKDVSDNIKALMSDLVKPRPDQMPFETITRTRKEPSTCSTQIQTNLITSSQIDLNVELHSNITSVYELNKAESSETEIAKKAVSEVIEVVDDSKTDVNKSYRKTNFKERTSLRKSSEGPVLVFDHNNPLNNVLLAPSECVDFHKYNPAKSSQILESESSFNKTKNDENVDQNEEERVTTQYRVESHVGLPSGDACSDRKGDSHSLFSDPSKPLSMDRSTEGIAMEVKDTEVNTLIVMKGNKELLEASSSLTLVDDALTQSVFDIRVQTRSNKDSPVKVIYKNDEDASMLDNIDSDMVSNDEELVEYTKAKKRSYSPTRRDDKRPTAVSSPDVTPKPLNKMQKISNSPNVYKNIDIPDETDDEKMDIKDTHKKKNSPRKSKGSPKNTKPGTDVTVQQLIAEYKITKMEQDLIEEQIIEAMHDRLSSRKAASCCDGIRSPDIVSSCTSKSPEAVKDTVSYVGSQPSRVDWQGELEQSKAVLECESGVNVVAKIDMLPFMGSRECEWETSGGDTWVFRLLRSCIRLRVRLAHRHHNALRSRVRADTPVTDIGVHIAMGEEKDPLVALCVRFAAEAMRYECGRSGARAGDVPAALRRCAAVARVAWRWARAMRDARVRLAYTLSPDGVLALKVANIPLRSVWEVSMKLELVVEDAREAAWVRAGDVRVAAVVAESAVRAADVRRALAPLPHDWGHVPRTVWKIFRYLKNKTRDDSFLGL